MNERYRSLSIAADSPIRVRLRVGDVAPPEGEAVLIEEAATAWIAEAGLEYPISVSKLLTASLIGLRQIDWLSTSANTVREVDGETSESPLSRECRILCFIPHYGCERYLGRCLSSITRQTRPLDSIVVVDDASEIPPTSIVARYPSVTLLRSEVHVGPYCLLQSLMEISRCEAFLFQDADDWSAVDRLELLITEACRTGADVIGGHVLRVYEDSGVIMPTVFPSDVNAALTRAPCHCSQHSTNLMTRKCIEALGGWASGLRYGADTEFIFRAHFKFRIRNADQFSYFRTIRPDSLTGSVETGLNSIGRRRLIHIVKSLAQNNNARYLAGNRLRLRPLKTCTSVRLRHVCGPALL
jgi:hypothetical protein